MSKTNRIKELRKQNKWTQQRMAKFFHINVTTFQKWEQGFSQPDLDQFHTLAQIFEVSMEYLGGYSDERNGSSN